MRHQKLFLVVALVVLAGCLVFAATAPKKLSATGFVGRTGETTVIVDTDLASQASDAPFLPLIVWVGHREAHAVKAGRASFTLLDPQGSTLALAGFSEVLKGYGANRISADHSRLRAQSQHYQYADMEFFYGRPLRGVAFFPDPSSMEVLYDQVELPARTYFRTLLYFPNPGARPEGTFTLRFEDTEARARVEVPLTFTWSKGQR